MFLDGLPGVGLLALRVAAGASLMWYGSACILDGRNPSVFEDALAVLAFGIGLSLFVGYLTPFAALFAGMTSVVIDLLGVPDGILNATGTRVGSGFLVLIAFALACLGPGRFRSTRGRYGRHEIIIPQRPKYSSDE